MTTTATASAAPATLTRMPARVNVVMAQRSTLRRVLLLTNADGTATDLTGAQLLCQVRRQPLDDAVAFEPQIAIDADPTLGRAELLVEEDDTAGLEVGARIEDRASRFVWDLVLIDSLGDRWPMITGDWLIYRTTVRPAPGP